MKNLCLTLFALLLSVASFAALPPITGVLTICSGSFTTLSNSVPAGTWTSGNPAIATIGSTSGIAVGVASGTAAITYTDGIDFAYATVTVNPLPGTITGVMTVCTGSTSLLSSASPGGMWSSASPAIATVDAAGMVTGIATGMTGITYTLVTGCYRSVMVTVSALPAPITGPPSVCVANTATYSSASPGGMWSISSIAVATVSGVGMVTGIAPGVATLSYTIGTGCFTTTSVTVNAAAPSITGSPVACVGLTSTLGNPVAGGTWISANSTIASVGATTGVVTGNTAGTTTIYYYLPSACYASTVFTVNVAPGPITGTASLCAGATTTLSGTGSGGTWGTSTPTIATVSPAGVVYGAAIGTSVISYTLSSCGTTTRTVTVVSTCGGTPTPGMITASAPIVCSGNPVTLNLPAYAPACGHIIQWQYSPDGIFWSNLPGANTVPYTYVPTTAYYYRCNITCASSGLSATSGPVHVALNFAIAAHNIIDAPSATCAPTHFYVAACGVSTVFSVTTFFGDGTSVSTPLSTTTLSDAHVYHTYSLPGTYTVRHILYNGPTPVDTVVDSYNYLFCRVLPISFYHDNNSNCLFDAGDGDNLASVITRVDSSGIPVDTITATSGFYYKALGGPGTVYAFRPLSVAGGLVSACPASGVIYDTITTYTNTYVTKRFGIRCGISPDFDLKVNATVSTGRHSQRFDITITNFYCTSITPVLTLNFSPKYGYYSSWGITSPPPTSVTGTTATWNLTALAANATRNITIWLERPLSLGPWLIPGDTVNSIISVSPTSGDLNPSNNVIVRTDTVKSSFDPNDIAVAPEGYILPCTQLQYKVRFENTGNDTAHNIYVLDTLSADLDPSSLAVDVASHAMNVSVTNDGVYNIARFDFPNINLLDTSHHMFCNGMFIFNVKARSTLADGTILMNRVGIYFDDNPVVMTNEVNNIGGLPSLTGPGNVCIGYPAAYFNSMVGGTWASSTPSVGTITGSGVVSGIAAGTSLISYTVANSCTSRTATQEVTVNPVVIPTVDIAAAPGITVCAGTSVSYTSTSTFAGTTPVYTWRVNGTSVGSGSSYTYTPTAGDTITVALASSQACAIPAIAADTMGMNVIAMAMPVASVSVSPGVTSCEGTPVTFTATPSFGGSAPGYTWYVNGTASGVSSSFIYTPATGDNVYCRMGSDFMCRLADTVNSAVVHMTVDPLYIPVISISAAPGLSSPPGTPITFTATTINAGPTPTYEWLVNGYIVPGANTNTYTTSTLNDYDSVTCKVLGSGVCGISTFKSVYVSIWANAVKDVMAGYDVHIMPNPNRGSFLIKGTIGFVAGKEVAVVISNMLGQVVYNSSVITGGNGLIDEAVQLPEILASGVYILNLHADNENKVFRFVVDK